MERLQKFIANSGYCSRRKAEELISKGQVYVNGEMVTELGTKVSGKEDIVVEGVTLGKQTRKEYYLLNKPRGYICSVSDDKGRKVVTDLINTNEILGARLLSIHNIRFLTKLMEDIKTAIREDRLLDFKDKFLARYNAGSIKNASEKQNKKK